MRALITYFIKYPVMGNVLMLSIFIFGFFGLKNMKSTFFPETESRTIIISSVLLGASPEEIEEAIVQKIEENLRGLTGVEEITSTSSENTANIVITLRDGIKADDKIIEVQNAVNSIASFPAGMEPVRVYKRLNIDVAMELAISGTEDLKTLKEYARNIENDLLNIKGISQVALSGFPAEEIEIAFRENDLQKYGLTLAEARQVVARQNIDITGGSIKTDTEELLIRSRQKKYYGEDLRDIVLLTSNSGQIVRLSDVAIINDKWSENPNRYFFNGEKAIGITVSKTLDEDIIDITDKLKVYVEDYNSVNKTVEIAITNDRSIALRQRIELFTKNGIQGFLLVCLVLSLFLNWRVAFWVALSIPVAFAGMFFLGSMTGLTINVLSLFGLILVLGILVDDGIVISENIYQKYESGVDRITAAVDGTMEVFPAVTAAVLTTIVAFSLFFFIDGRLGEFFSDVAVVVLWTLAFSLVEGALILPAHIAHSAALKKGATQNFITKYFYKGLFWTRDRIYAPSLKFSLRYPFLVFAVCVSILLLTIGSLGGGVIKTTFFPNIESDRLTINLKMPAGTRESVTENWLNHIDEAVQFVNNEYKKDRVDSLDIVKYSLKKLGPNSYSGNISLILLESDIRQVKSIDITNKIRAAVGDIPNAEQVTFGAASVFGKAVSISLSSQNKIELSAAVSAVKQTLQDMSELKDVVDNNAPGLREVNIKLKDKAYTLGLTEQVILKQVRDGFFGSEVQRVQRGRDEIRIWVRYDIADRSSLSNLDQMRVQVGNGVSFPFSELATYRIERGVVSLYHLDGKREVRIDADVASDQVSAADITNDLEGVILPQILAAYPSVDSRFVGQKLQQEKTTGSIGKVFPIILIIMLIIIAIAFKAYAQPIIVVLLLPFGIIGVGWGHWLIDNLGISEIPVQVSLLSGLGIIALIGIMVNDALVFVAAFNQYLQEGASFTKALYKAGLSRYRPIILTSITTIVGLLPILWETSFQAQFLKPMAIAIAFGLLFVTVIILILLPIIIVFYNNIKRSIYASYEYLWNANKEVKPREYYEPAVEELKDAKVEE